MKMKMIALGLAVALGAGVTTATADVINNDINQLSAFNPQNNFSAIALGFNAGATNVSQINVLNQGTLTISNAVDDAYDNDVIQVAVLNEQGNAVIALVAVNAGKVAIDQVNAINVANTDIDALDDVKGNDVIQFGLLQVQGNFIGIGNIVQAGKIKLDQVNVVNAADVKLTGTQVVGGNLEEVDDNSVVQVGGYLLQGNLVIGLQAVGLGKTVVDQTNLVNVATVEIFAEDADFNTTEQYAGAITQGNGLFLARGINVGKLDASQTNAVNSASLDVDIDSNGGNGFQFASENDIFQDADGSGPLSGIDQDNVVVVLRGATIGRTELEQLNLVNGASTKFRGTTGVIDNDITQLADGDLGHIDQNNDIDVGAVINAGKLKVGQVNVVNNASVDIDVDFGPVSGNDVDQIATGVIQSNNTSVVIGASLGNTKIDQLNGVNLATVEIGTIGPVVDNTVNQVAVGNIQTNVATKVGVVNGGKIGISQANASNVGTINIQP